MGVHQCHGDLHACEGTIDMEAYIGTIFCTETYNAIKMKSFLGSNLILHMLNFKLANKIEIKNVTIIDEF